MKYICAVLLVIGTSAHAWGDPISLASLNLGTPAVSEDFEDLSTCENTPGNEGGGTIQTDQTAYGVFTNTYVGKSTEIGFGIYSAADPFTSKYLKIFADGAKYTGVCFTRSFTSKGSYDITISKSSNGWFGLYAAVGNGELNNKNNNTVYFSWDGTDLKIANGDASTKDSHVWQLVSSPTTDLIRVTVVYNLSNSDDTYGGITIGHGKAHVFVNGTAIMDGDNPKAFTIPEERTPTYFRIYTKESAGVSADDLKIYDALPSNTFSVTYDGNGNTGGDVPTDNTDYSSGATVTVSGNSGSLVRTGYTFDGWNTLANGSGTPYAAGATFTITENATLYAQWSLNSHTLAVASVANVSINATTPSVAEGSSTSVNYGTTVTLSHGSPDGGRQWGGWNVYKTGDASTMVTVNSDNQFSMPDYNVTVSANLYTDLVFSCAELTLTPFLATAGTPIFITSTTSKTVRSQDKIEIVGTGLTPGTTLTIALSDPSLASKFAIKKANGDPLVTNGSGAITEDAYIFYTPAAGDESDGLDKLEWITVSVGGAKPITKKLTQDIIGRHLPADFVIAAKNTNNNKWYALPADFSDEQTPAPVEIAVDDINNPSVAYTANTNIYNLYGQNSGVSGYLYNDGDGDDNPDGEKIKLGMKNNSNKPLFAFAGDKSSLKGDETATVTNNIGKQYWWTLTQTNTSIENPRDAKYTIASSNNAKTMSAWFNTAPQKWGLFAAGNGEHTLRLIPVSDIEYTESEVVAWGQKKLILEVALPTGATQARAKIADGSWSANKSLATTTGTSIKGTATKYNYTLDFTGEIDFSSADNEGKMLIIELLNSGGSPLKASSVIIPRIVAADRTINKKNDATKGPWNTEVHVLPGVTLTLDASGYDPTTMTIDELNIYPGATVNVSSGTLISTTLVMRNGWDRLSGATNKFDVARLYIKSTANMTHTNAYSDWYIDYDQYYPIAIPFPVSTSSISYKNTNSSASAGVRLRYYSGELRATNIQQNQDANWVEYTWGLGGTMPANLEPSKGYAMTAKRPTGKAFSIVRMPMTFTNDWTTMGELGSIEVDEVTTHKDEVAVTAWGNASTPSYAKGWNIIANPYMALHQGELSYNDGSGDVIEYANIPDIHFKEYDQLPIETTKLKPSSAFLVQAPKTGTVTFGATARVVSAPSYKTESTPVSSKQKAYIELSNEEANDMMGLIISDQYTAEYEINADLEKLLGDGTSLKTYMRYDDRNMAYVAINKVLAQEWIPVNVRLPQTGEYTFSLHEASIAGELEGVYLIDYTSNEVTNLIENSYVFTATAGTISNRFAINATVGERQTPTDIDVVNGGGDLNSDRPIKFLYRDKVYIWHRGVIYDATGKKVR